MEFNERLSKWFKSRQISQKVVAETLGYSKSNMSHYFNTREPNFELLSKLALHYPDLDMNYLFKDAEVYRNVNFFGEPEMEYSNKNIAIIEDIENKLKELKDQMTR